MAAVLNSVSVYSKDGVPHFIARFSDRSTMEVENFSPGIERLKDVECVIGTRVTEKELMDLLKLEVQTEDCE